MTREQLCRLRTACPVHHRCSCCRLSIQTGVQHKSTLQRHGEHKCKSKYPCIESGQTTPLKQLTKTEISSRGPCTPRGSAITESKRSALWTQIPGLRSRLSFIPKCCSVHTQGLIQIPSGIFPKFL